MIKHPSCSTRTRSEKCDDLYCPIHGRIRDMDNGASPFGNPDAIAQASAARMGLTEEDVIAGYKEDDSALSPFAQRLRREASEADARATQESSFFDQEVGLERALNASFDRLKAAAPEGCLCDYSETFGVKQVIRHPRVGCPVHRLSLYERLLIEARLEREWGWIVRIGSRDAAFRGNAAHPINEYVSSNTRPANAEQMLMEASANVAA